jgi:HlyD family secretion protein
MKRWLTKRNIIILVILLVIGGMWYVKRQAASKKSQAAIRVVVVERKDVVSSLLVSGSIEVEKKAVLNFQGVGKLGFINVEEGEAVKKWQSLMGLNMGDLDAAVNAAFYKYLAADANAKYVEDTVKDHDKDETFTQKNTRVAAQTARDMAYDAWLTARRTRDYGTLISPFDGIVTNITVNTVGDTVGITDGATVVDPTSLVFRAEVDESDIGKVSMDKKVTVSLDAFPEEKFEGKIVQIGFVSMFSSSGATVFPVKIEIIGGGDKVFRIGMNGDAEIILDKAGNALSVPSEAIIDGEVILETTGQKTKVQTGLVGDENTEIKSGLSEGDKVIIK